MNSKIISEIREKVREREPRSRLEGQKLRSHNGSRMKAKELVPVSGRLKIRQESKEAGAALARYTWKIHCKLCHFNIKMCVVS